MRILISGGSGIIGSALVEKLKANGHICHILTRGGSDSKNGIFHWNNNYSQMGENITHENDKSLSDFPDHTIEMDAEALSVIDTIIHLAGESIGSQRWSEKQKKFCV